MFYKEGLKNLNAWRIRRKLDWFYEIMIFYDNWFYFQSLRVKHAKDIENTLRKFTDYFKIPVYIKYYWIEKTRKKPRNITNFEYRQQK